MGDRMAMEEWVAKMAASGKEVGITDLMQMAPAMLLQTIDDLHRMADYFNQLRLLTFAMTAIGMLSGLIFLLFRYTQHRNKRIKKRAIMKHGNRFSMDAPMSMGNGDVGAYGQKAPGHYARMNPLDQTDYSMAQVSYRPTTHENAYGTLSRQHATLGRGNNVGMAEADPLASRRQSRHASAMDVHDAHDAPTAVVSAAAQH